MDIFGPFDADSPGAQELDVSDFSEHILDLGSLKIPLPHGAEVQVEMGEQGPKLLHIVTPFGRMTPVGFAAAKTGNLWREVYPSIVDGMTNDGLAAHVEDGPWGAEVVGKTERATLRLIGVQGGRWMIRFTCAAPNETADEMTEVARETISRTVVDRGSTPIPPGQPLPISVPNQLADQIRRAMEQSSRAGAQGSTGQSTIARQPKDVPPTRDTHSSDASGWSHEEVSRRVESPQRDDLGVASPHSFDQSAHDRRTEAPGVNRPDSSQNPSDSRFIESTRGDAQPHDAKEARQRMFEWRSDSVNGSAIQQIAPQNRTFGPTEK
ncbi:DUF3710 domain-containing protein [Corynebacterium pyruviciproducens]|uniref:DUF3710 domain-containing protein n=1 Tax=Corynebacterium pyruviciproducens TaxID=598660 RepID=A0AAF1BX85_9CORY|nr:DUF3710 domain-containing protein [Corynebacterium pyruviciproducens]MDH4657884.1 DUF3710 domain-containing protein [Corynebacterium pyruviciproducens]MDK6566399.1 DUF3710 domain-containing protein [Corynebacterium pyruviciproducens]WOT03172.1 DUF3710 domain-containing protein [Corynebacterium pyruviciproducens]